MIISYSRVGQPRLSVDFKLTLKNILTSLPDDEEHGAKTDEGDEENLREFSKRVARQPTPTLESMLAEFSMEINFLEDQVLAEPELFAFGYGKSVADRKLRMTKKRLLIVKDEIEIRERR